MTLTWLQIARLGLVQTALGAIVLLTTATLNRLMVVELSLPALLPGLLVGLYYGIQITRPHWGFRSDTEGRRTRWIIVGMAGLAVGGMAAAVSVVVMEQAFLHGLALAIAAYALIGLGVGACGTSLLALLATATAPHRRAAAATIVWLMMIFGIAVTAILVGLHLDPENAQATGYSPALLLRIVAIVTGAAFLVTVITVQGIEARVAATREPDPVPFREGLAEVWAEPHARHFTIFVFLSMTAYFMQELILEPYAGLVFGFTPGQSTALGGPQNGGAFLGMLCVGILASGLKIGSLRAWTVAGCVGSAAALAMIAMLGQIGPGAPLVPAVAALGFFNGMFAVAAIGSMMALAHDGRERREGTRMGLWGAAQAIAGGVGVILGSGLVDLARLSLPDAQAFGTVFLTEAALFLAAAAMAARILGRQPAQPPVFAGE